RGQGHHEYDSLSAWSPDQGRQEPLPLPELRAHISPRAPVSRFHSLTNSTSRQATQAEIKGDMSMKSISRRRFAGLVAGAIAGSVALPRRGWAASPKLQVSYSRTAIHHAAYVYLAANAAKYGLSVELLNFDRYADALV